ncbi:unnamed protein product, partial [Didymodactylos carnosus]
IKMVNLSNSSSGSNAHQQMRKTVEQLRFEVNLHRELASVTLNDLIKFCHAHAPADCLVAGFQHKEQNPWKERRVCSMKIEMDGTQQQSSMFEQIYQTVQKDLKNSSWNVTNIRELTTKNGSVEHRAAVEYAFRSVLFELMVNRNFVKE